MKDVYDGDMPADEVVTQVRGHAGVVILNRPKSINALNHTMVTAIATQLLEWSEDPRIAHVVIAGAGERGLCAGGDIVAIYHDAQSGGSASRDFWRDEYRLNAFVHRYSKPVVAFMDGLVMGGGVGISAHASHRVVTDTSRIAMPEVGIGFIPDVGGTYLLARAPRHLGVYAALTGTPLQAGDAIAVGLADHFAPHDQLSALLDDLSRQSVSEAVERHAVTAPDSPLASLDWIDGAFSAPTARGIIDALQATGDADAARVAELIMAKSPIAVSVTLEALHRAGRATDLEEVLSQEYRTSSAALDSHDLVEGIRAQVIDKDRQPKWSPADLGAVTAADIDAYFAPPSTGTDLTWKEASNAE